MLKIRHQKWLSHSCGDQLGLLKAIEADFNEAQLITALVLIQILSTWLFSARSIAPAEHLPHSD